MDGGNITSTLAGWLTIEACEDVYPRMTNSHISKRDFRKNGEKSFGMRRLYTDAIEILLDFENTPELGKC